MRILRIYLEIGVGGRILLITEKIFHFIVAYLEICGKTIIGSLEMRLVMVAFLIVFAIVLFLVNVVLLIAGEKPYGSEEDKHTK